MLGIQKPGLPALIFQLALGYLVPPNLEGLVLTHFSHRVMAYVNYPCLFSFLFIASKLSIKLKDARKDINLALLCIIAQIALGIWVVYSRLTFYVTALHLSLALIILSITLLAWFKYIDKSYT